MEFTLVHAVQLARIEDMLKHLTHKVNIIMVDESKLVASAARLEANVKTLLADRAVIAEKLHAVSNQLAAGGDQAAAQASIDQLVAELDATSVAIENVEGATGSAAAGAAAGAPVAGSTGP